MHYIRIDAVPNGGMLLSLILSCLRDGKKMMIDCLLVIQLMRHLKKWPYLEICTSWPYIGLWNLFDMYYIQSHSQQRHCRGLGILIPSF
jgi:hypothetical protein